MSRTTAAQRAKSSVVAEREIMRFAVPDPDTGIRPHALWHKHVHNVELDPIQCLKMQEMDAQPWAWITDKLLSEIAQRNFRYPFEFGEIDDVPVLCVRTAHVMSHMSTTATLREFWDGLPVKSDRIYKKQLATAGVLMDGKDGQPLTVERTVGSTRVSNMVAFKLEGLRQYGLHAAVPAKGSSGHGGHGDDGYGDREPGPFGA